MKMISNHAHPAMSAPSPATPLPAAQVAALLRQARLRIEALEGQIHSPIAIIGVGCRFPGGASTPAAFWQNLVAGHDAIGPVPSDRWPAAVTPALAPQWGGFLKAVDHFDPAFFAISGREAPYLDPQQRLLLETAWEALERAGIAPTNLAGSQTGVFIGISSNDYGRLQQQLDIPVNAYAGTGNAFSIAANRISYLLGLHGPSLAIDTACSSALVAVHHACQSLRRGECEGALVGGVNLILTPDLTEAFTQAGMLAADGRCKTFDQRADGYVRSEGAAVIYLKRLADAQRDQDPILAIIHGSAINQDGRSNGLTAPNGLAQQRVIRAALQDARVSPAHIGYVETHGTGTALGDPIEVNALKAVLTEGRTQDQPCWLGAVKANIGHLEAAAGLAGLIKATLCLAHGLIPPQPHLEQLNPAIDLATSGLAIPTQPQPWPAGATPRYAGVSAFGFGGTNAHLILGEAPIVAAGEQGPTLALPREGMVTVALQDQLLPGAAGQGQNFIARRHQLITLSAPTAAGLQALAGVHAAELAESHVDLADLAYTLNTGRSHFAQRLALVVDDQAQLQAALRAFAAGQPTPATLLGVREQGQRVTVAFLFTGQGAQYGAMGWELYQSAPVFRQAIDQCDALLHPLIGRSLVELLYANATGAADGQADFNQTAYTQPALFAVEYALAQLWLAWGIKPDFVIGHSVGEIVAACVAGAFSLAEGLQLVARRGQLMQGLPANGAMAAIFADAATVEAALAPWAEQVAIAAFNGPTHTVISGEGAAVATLLATFAAQGIDAQPLTVSHAFHSPLMEPILADLWAAAAQVAFQPLQIGLLSTLTGELCAVGHRFTATYWRDQARQPVRFTQALARLAALECRLYLELGPKPILCRLSKRHFDAGYHWLPSLNPPQGAWATLLNSLGRLYTQGVPVTWSALDQGESRRRLALPTYPFQRQRYWLPEGKHLMYTNGTTPVPVAPTLAPTIPAPAQPAPRPNAAGTRMQTLLAELHGMASSLLQLPADQIPLNTGLLELGADSLILLDTTRRIEQRYGVKIPLQRFFDDLTTLTALAIYLDEQLPAAWSPVSERREATSAAADHHAPQPAAAQLEAHARHSAVPLPEGAPSRSLLQPATTQQLLSIIAKQLELLTRYDLTAPALTPFAPMIDTSTMMEPLTSVSPAPVAASPAKGTPTPLPVPTKAPTVVPLTEAQQQLWFLSQLSEASSIAYNELVTLHLQGNLDLAALQHAVQLLVDRHEALRTIIDPSGETQRILPDLTAEVALVDLATHASDAAVAAWLDQESYTPINLETGPLFRVNLLKVGAADHLLVLTVHHIIIDGVSLGILVQELAQLYSAACANRPLALPPVPQLSDYVAWQRRQLATPVLASQERYWLEQLAGTLPVLELPLDRPRPPLQSYTGGVITLTLAADLTNRLKALSRQQGCTLFMTLLAAYKLWLHRLSGQEEVIVGIPAAGRAMPDGERMVGYCAHLLPIRHTLVGNPSFTALLHELRKLLLAAYANQDYPFARLINKLNVNRDLSLAPIVGSTFNLIHQPALPTFAGLTTTLGPRPTQFVDHELGLNVIEHGGVLTVDFEYNADLFDQATVARLAGHFVTLLQGIVASPTMPVALLPLLNAAERRQLLLEWNQTAYPFDARAGYHELFEAQVAKTPDAVAVLYEGERLTYAELNRLANGFAHQLRAAGVGVDSVVALLCDRSPLFLAAAIAIFKAGGAYLPLDVRAPASRQGQVLGQSRTKLLLITADFAEASAEALAMLPVDQQPQVCSLETWRDHAQANHLGLTNLPTLDPYEDLGARLAYVIYTSGSTGLPKGAMVEQRGMVNHIYAKLKDLELTAADTVAQTAPQSFDISVWQFFSTLIIGGRVHIFPDQVAADPTALLEGTASGQITILEVVPSLMRMMVDALAQGLVVDLQRLRWLIPTGEALPPNLARQWLRLCPQIPLVNAYGPTECSDDVTHYFVTEPPAATVVNMPIGRPIINMRMYILDAHLQPVPIGVAGELYVGGIGVGRGYIYDPERTALAFIPDPFSPDERARLYKTGDKARYLPASAGEPANIEYLGRLDYQVKIRGFRIELGEIEAVLEQHALVYQAIVMDQPDPTGSKRLVAYVVPDGEMAMERLTPGDLRTFLGAQLPDYMVPAAFVLLERMPLTPNGKVDRKALPLPSAATWGTQTEYIAPQTELQAQLVTIWAELLKVEPAMIGIGHNFFELGGHSLLGTQVIARIRSTFQVELPIRALMENPTIQAIADAIQSQQLLRTMLPTAPTVDHTHEVIEL